MTRIFELTSMVSSLVLSIILLSNTDNLGLMLFVGVVDNLRRSNTHRKVTIEEKAANREWAGKRLTTGIGQ